MTHQLFPIHRSVSTTMFSNMATDVSRLDNFRISSNCKSVGSKSCGAPRRTRCRTIAASHPQGHTWLIFPQSGADVSTQPFMRWPSSAWPLGTSTMSSWQAHHAGRAAKSYSKTAQTATSKCHDSSTEITRDSHFYKCSKSCIFHCFSPFSPSCLS